MIAIWYCRTLISPNTKHWVYNSEDKETDFWDTWMMKDTLVYQDKLEHSKNYFDYK